MAKSCTLSISLMILQLGAAQTLETAQPSQGQIRNQWLPFSIDFTATNAAGAWAIVAEATGSIELRGDVLKVFVKTCTLARPLRFGDPETVVSIVTGISRARPEGNWELVRLSERQLVQHSLAPGEQTQLQPFEQTIPIDFAMERGDRLTFQISGTYTKDGQKRGGFVYVHTRPQLAGRFSYANEA